MFLHIAIKRNQLDNEGRTLLDEQGLLEGFKMSGMSPSFES